MKTEYKILETDTLLNVEQLEKLALKKWFLITIVTTTEYFYSGGPGGMKHERTIFHFYFQRTVMN